MAEVFEVPKDLVSHKYIFERIYNFFRRTSTRYPGFEEFEVTPSALIVKTRYDNGVRYGSRLGPWFSTGDTAFKTKHEGRLALAQFVWEMFLEAETDLEASNFLNNGRELALYARVPGDLGFIDNPLKPTDEEIHDDGCLQFAALKMRFLQMPFKVFSRVHGQLLAENLVEIMRDGGVSTNEAISFTRGYTKGILDVLLQRQASEPKDPNNDPYPFFKLELFTTEKKENQDVAETALGFVFVVQKEQLKQMEKPWQIRPLAQMLGQASAKQLVDIEIGVALAFWQWLSRTLKRSLKDWKEKEDLKDVEMGGM